MERDDDKGRMSDELGDVSGGSVEGQWRICRGFMARCDVMHDIRDESGERVVCHVI